jgi:hypothetical protein
MGLLGVWASRYAGNSWFFGLQRQKGIQMRPRHTILSSLALTLICGACAAAAQEGPLKPKDMPGYCAKVAVDTFALKPNKVKVKKAAETGGAFAVTGTADQGENGKRTFHCNFDMAGMFVGMAVENTGGE